MSENNIQLNNVTNLQGLSHVDFSEGFTCDMETGICGSADEINKAKQKDEEKKNANNDLV